MAEVGGVAAEDDQHATGEAVWLCSSAVGEGDSFTERCRLGYPAAAASSTSGVALLPEDH